MPREPLDLVLGEDLSPAEVREVLSPLGFADWRAADRNLQRVAGEPPDRLAFAEIFPALLDHLSTSADPDMALNNFERFVAAGGNRATLFRYLSTDPRLMEILIVLFAGSQFLSDVLIRNPEYFVLLADQGHRTIQKTREEFVRERDAVLTPFRSPRAKLDALRRFQRRALLTIGAADLTGELDLMGVTEQLSLLSEILIEGCLHITRATTASDFGFRISDFGLGGAGGTPQSRDAQFIVVAMGKLGGSELNYSSDIDLIFLYSSPDSSAEPDAEAFFTRLAQSLIAALSEPTGEGYLYRVDMRLRPYGRAGPLVPSFETALAYYESWSEPWERQALLKARPIAGDPELCHRFRRFVDEFVHARRIDPSDIAELRAVKRRSERQTPQASRNVKTGPGGIRDVEFTVQLLQLIAGPDHPEVRSPNTLQAISALRDCALLTQEEATHLTDGYHFLRTLEHRMQMVHELPLKVLPAGEDLHRLARRMGYPGANSLMTDYRMHTARVSAIHKQLFHGIAEDQPDEEVRQIERILQNDARSDQIQEILSRYGFTDPDRAQENLRRMVYGPTHRSLPLRERKRILRGFPHLLRFIGASADPDVALSSMETLSAATGNRASFLAMLADHPRATELLSRLAGTSPFLFDVLVRRPELLDVLMDPTSMTAPKHRETMLQELRMRAQAERDLKGQLNALRRYKRREMLRIGARDVAGKADVMEVAREISELAEASLQLALDLCEPPLYERHGRPSATVAIIGLGKLGGRELHYSSDLDVIFVFSEDGQTTGSIPLSHARTYDLLARETLKAIGGLTEEGYDFKMDVRLRPDGSAGLLARSLDGYLHYLRERAAIWERQALIRARPVAGDPDLGAQFVKAIEAYIYRPHLDPEDVEEIRHLKRRIEHERASRRKDVLDVKLGPGGIVDIEFTVQFLQLQYGHAHPTIREPNTLCAIEAIREAGILSTEDAQALMDAYRFLRTIEARLQIAEQRSQSLLPLDPRALNRLARGLGYTSDALLSMYRRHTATVRALHERVLYRERNR